MATKSPQGILGRDAPALGILIGRPLERLMQSSPIRVIKIITIIDRDKSDVGSVGQIDRLIKDKTTIAHPAM